MEVPRFNNVKTEAALGIVETHDMWETSEGDRLWTHAAHITRITHTQWEEDLSAGVKHSCLEHLLMAA